LGHVGGGLALGLLISQIEEANADGLDLLVHRIPPVALLVTPLLVFGVRGGSVYLHARPVVLVEVIQVPIAGLLPDSGLPFCWWQAVRSLHAPDVTQFEQGEHAFAGVAERELDVAPPADPRAGVHRLAYPLRGLTPAPDGAADPVVCLAEASRAFDEVEHGLVDPGARRRENRMPGMCGRT
jgi:hypothetical protein